MFIGGLGDQFIWSYLDVHLKISRNPENSELLKRADELSMLMLHSAGGGLMSTGISMFCLTHFAIKKGQPWAKWTFFIIAFIAFIAFIAQGINGYGMYSAGSHFWYPILVLVLLLSVS